MPHLLRSLKRCDSKPSSTRLSCMSQFLIWSLLVDVISLSGNVPAGGKDPVAPVDVLARFLIKFIILTASE